MLTIETRGSWREMGRQMGEAFREELRQCMDRFCPRLVADPDTYAPTIAALRKEVSALAPELIEETDGWAEGANQDPGIVFGYRFANDVRLGTMREGCTVIWLNGGEHGPLLGRNCDLEPDISQDIQLLRVAHPDNAAAFINSSYLGMVNGAGITEHGLAGGGASAHTDATYGTGGTAGALLQYMLLHHYRTVADAGQALARHTFFGKPLNVLVADRSGASRIFEFAAGRPAVQVPRPPRHTWQVCTNFFVSGEIPIQPEPEYLENAYARYGRLVHQLDGHHVPHTVEGMKTLLTEIAQPGLCNSGREGKSLTAYSLIAELATGRVHYAPGHPAKTAWKHVSIGG